MNRSDFVANRTVPMEEGRRLVRDTPGLCATPISRRCFLSGVGALGFTAFGAFALAGCAPDAASTSTASSASSGTAVNVVVNNGNPPYCYLDDDGNPVGYDYDVLKAVDDRLDGYTFSISAMEFSAMITACESGSADLVSCQLVPNDDRKAKFIFCKEPFTLSPMVFAVASPNIKTMDDMAGKSVATSPTAYEYGMLQDYNKKYPDKALVLQTISNLTAADSFKMVASGQVDSVLCYDGSFDTVNDETGTGLYKTDVVMCESTYFMLNKSQQDLADAIDGVLKDMKSDGSLSQIATKDLGCDVFTTYANDLSDEQLMNS